MHWEALLSRKRKVIGVAELSRRLKAIPEEARKASYQAAERAADRIAQDMRAMVPVDTGNLKRSIVVTEGGQRPPSYAGFGTGSRIPENAVAVTAGNSGARHAHLVEFGTSKAKAQPFFLPAWRSNRNKARRS